MTGNLLPVVVWRAIDANGLAMSGAKLYFYLTGTTTPTNTYTSSTLGTPNANPLVSDSGGLFAVAYLNPAITYRVMLKTSGGSTILDVDPFTVAANIAAGQVTGAMLASGAVNTELGYTAANDASVLKIGKHVIPVNAGAMTPRTTNGPATGTTELATNKVMLASLDYDAATDEGAQFMIGMPKSWNESTVTCRFRWTAASGSGSVVWALAGVAFSDDDAMDAAFGSTVTVTDTLLSANDMHISAETSAMTIAGTPAAGDTVCFQAYRVASNGSDTLAVDAKLLGVDLFITLDAATDA